MKKPMKKTKKQLATEIVKKLVKNGHEAYFAGGCVRDMLLGRTAKDYDIATSALPEEIERLFSSTVAIGKSFGVINVIEQKENFEVATFRIESGYEDKRRPSHVEFSSAQEDCRRRDLTINALFFDPLKNKVIDYVGGEEDLRKGVIRFVGDASERIEEDHLRLIRAVRFKVILGFQYSRETFNIIKSKSKLIKEVAPERIRDELNLIFSSFNRHIGLIELSQSGILEEVIPELEALKGVPQPLEYHHEGDVFTHVYLALRSLKRDTPSFIAWAVLLHDIAKPQTFNEENGRITFYNHAEQSAAKATEILRRLKFPNYEIETVEWLIHYHMRIGDIDKMRPSKKMNFVLDPRFPMLIELVRADSEGTYPVNTELVEKMQSDLVAAKKNQREMSKFPQKNLITGDDLIKLGFEPSPKFKQILEQANDYAISNSASKKQTLIFISKNFHK